MIEVDCRLVYVAAQVGSSLGLVRSHHSLLGVIIIHTQQTFHDYGKRESIPKANSYLVIIFIQQVHQHYHLILSAN